MAQNCKRLTLTFGSWLEIKGKDSKTQDRDASTIRIRCHDCYETTTDRRDMGLSKGEN